MLQYPDRTHQEKSFPSLATVSSTGGNGPDRRAGRERSERPIINDTGNMRDSESNVKENRAKGQGPVNRHPGNLDPPP